MCFPWVGQSAYSYHLGSGVGLGDPTLEWIPPSLVPAVWLAFPSVSVASLKLEVVSPPLGETNPVMSSAPHNDLGKDLPPRQITDGIPKVLPSLNNYTLSPSYWAS